jgi:hypothetical protein
LQSTEPSGSVLQNITEHRNSPKKQIWKILLYNIFMVYSATYFWKRPVLSTFPLWGVRLGRFLRQGFAL